MLPIGLIASAIQSVLRKPGVQANLARVAFTVLSKSETQNKIKEGSDFILETISEFASTCRIRLNNGEIEAKTVVQFVQKTYSVGDVSNSTVIQGEHIVNNTTINICINVQNFHEITNILSEVPEVRRQLENNKQNYDTLNLFADNTLNPFLGKLEKILSESTEYDKLKRALNSGIS
jgi:hypothetical protein